MSWGFRGGLWLRILIVVCTLFSWAQSAHATAPLPRLDVPARRVPLHKTSGTGVSIVRMPQRSPAAANTHVQQIPATPSRRTEPSLPQGRLIRLQARLGSQATDPQKGWLGVDMEPLELPLALSLGLPNADGALFLKAATGGPADRAGIRFGDIVVGLNGRIVPSINDLHQRISSMVPGSEALVEVWRTAGEGEEFLPVLQRLADSGNTHVMYRLGRMYAAGSGVARDDSEAVQWYRRAADAGNLNATTALAVALLDGRGTPVDPQAGLRLLRLAAARDHVEAANRLGAHPARGQDRRQRCAGGGRPIHQGRRSWPSALHGGPGIDVRQRQRRADGLRQGRHVVQAGRRSRQHARHG